ncbi:HNH endonuclease [Aliarcobacter butzleri]|uniref:HNH endonuclease n=1 Tax=Aliarcobacter butzleri TaxID=28197 RepID=UPI002B244087|nr:HNH endonuclease [Aliarcobacter butzleri]
MIYELKEILCGNFEKLIEIKNKLGKKDDNKIKSFFNYDKAKSTKFIPLISKLQPKISNFFQENIEVHTCYYCNIDFINTFKKNNKTKNAFTLDHVLEKADYPYLALSLYNLVPSCYVCNSKVKDSKILFDEFSPTNKDFDFDERVKFKSFISNINLQIEKEQDFYIKLIENYSNKYDKYIKSLNLNDRYDYHKYKVLEMIQKRREYPDSRIKELSDLTKKTQEEIKQDLFGIYTSEDLHKRPLSKLIKDISEELDLI